MMVAVMSSERETTLNRLSIDWLYQREMRGQARLSGFGPLRRGGGLSMRIAF